MTRTACRCGVGRAVTAALVLTAAPMTAQAPAPYGASRGTPNVELESHVRLGPRFTTGDIEIEQELSRPFVYVSRWTIGGVDVFDLGSPGEPERIWSWRIENPELHTGAGGTDGKYLKLDGRYYYVQGLQWQQGSPDADLGAVVFDVTDLPDGSKVREMGRIRAADTPGGFHNIYAYKHSDGRVLLFTTVNGSHANIYDMELFLNGAPEHGLIGRLQVPENPCPSGGLSQTWHDFYIAYDPATGQDKFYGAAQPVGAYVFDISQPEAPELLTSIVCAHGVTRDHTIQVSPDGRWAIADGHLRYNPIRIYDLQPGLDGEVPYIDRPVGAWTANWRRHAHNQEMRWPYVFVANYLEGFQVFNMADPGNPYTVGSYQTYDGDEDAVFGGGSSFFTEVANGAFGLDVRNADGLVVVADFSTGLWTFRVEGFNGWNGHDYGLPNISSVQDWDNGPDGSRRREIISRAGPEAESRPADAASSKTGGRR